MKKGLLYYCLILSLIIHLLIVLGIKLDNFKKKEKEPILVDLVGPLNWGPKTALPAGKEPPETKTASLRPPDRPVTERPQQQSRPFIPAIPVPPPAAPAANVPSPPAGMPPVPGEIASPAPQGQGRAAGTQANSPAPQVKAQPAPQAAPAPRRLMLPSQQDLEQYARAETLARNEQGGETVTLDTEDLMFTSYLQGLKKRIELIWKYPETARRDGLQGSLVLRFSIGKSGKLENVELLRSSGYPMLDEAAKQALMDANPFNPLPENWKKDSFTITGTFVYRIYGLYLR